MTDNQLQQLMNSNRQTQALLEQILSLLRLQGRK